MELFTCCCGWSFIIGKQRVYGAIYKMGIGDFPDALSNTQRMMTRQQFDDGYSDCLACWSGDHKHGQYHTRSTRHRL